MAALMAQIAATIYLSSSFLSKLKSLFVKSKRVSGFVKRSAMEISGQRNKLNVNHLTNFFDFFRLSSKKNSLAGQSEMSSDGSNSSRKENVPPELMICIDMNTGESFNYFDGYLFMHVSKSQLFLPI